MSDLGVKRGVNQNYKKALPSLNHPHWTKRALAQDFFSHRVIEYSYLSEYFMLVQESVTPVFVALHSKNR